MNKIQGRPDAELEDDTNDHTRYVTELGLPLWLAYLEDNLFECLPNDLSRTWPRRFAAAIPAGACVDDLVLAKILRWSLAAERFGVRYATVRLLAQGRRRLGLRSPVAADRDVG